MKDTLRNLAAGVCTLVHVGGICGLAYIALRRNNECYKAELKRIDAEFERDMTEIKCAVKDAKIVELENKLKEFEKSES